MLEALGAIFLVLLALGAVFGAILFYVYLSDRGKQLDRLEIMYGSLQSRIEELEDKE